MVVNELRSFMLAWHQTVGREKHRREQAAVPRPVRAGRKRKPYALREGRRRRPAGPKAKRPRPSAAQGGLIANEAQDVDGGSESEPEPDLDNLELL